MLAVRYNTATKGLTGLCRDKKQFDTLKDRGGETVIILHAPIPHKSLEAWLFDEATKTLIANPDYIEPEPTEIDKIKARLTALEEATLTDV